jgi:hypothetical protein
MNKSTPVSRTAQTAVALGLLAAVPAVAQYSARQEGDLVHLEDAKNHTVDSVITAVVNVAYE